ncbi:MAG: hypothetical protein MUC67_02120 [Acidobacteria bacterium]|jgi:hypothetical protein|nr:hypothetical protein [Acidobacteriota bacterium]
MPLPRIFLTVLLCAVIAAAPLALAEQMPAGAPPAHAETSWQVPELFAYHEVIATIWHEAWPAKDVAQLKALAPQVKSGADKVAAAKLPGILREKQAAWDQGVAALQKSVADYETAIAAGDDARLLAAAEALHAQFEKLVRTIRPVTKEIDAFHQALYPLYHHQLDPYDASAVTASAALLQERMAALAKAPLPERLAPKAAAYEQARAELGREVEAFAAAVATGDPAKSKAAAEVMHSAYVKLEAVFG